MKPQDEPRVQIALRLDADILERVDMLAEQQERHRSDVIRRCLNKGLDIEESKT